MSDDHGGRRLMDKTSVQWLVFSAAMGPIAIAIAVWMIIKFYAPLPDRLQEQREEQIRTTAALERLTEKFQDQNELLKNLNGMPARMQALETKVERIDERVHKLEQPPTFLGRIGAEKRK